MAGTVAGAILDGLVSPNEVDSNFESANVVDAIFELARALRWSARVLGNGDASTPMGAMEALGKAIKDAADRVAQSNEEVAAALRESGSRAHE